MIPVFDITRQNEILKRELTSAFALVVEKGVFILGDHVERFEKAFAHYIGTSFAVGVASGTDALTLSLLALGLQPGDEVILPANSYPSVFGISAIGAIPRLVDIDPTTYTIDPERIANAITKKTKAIIPVHLYGQAADMEAIMAVGKKYNLKVIEDCAQAVGAEVRCQESGIRDQGSGDKKNNITDSETYNLKPETFSWKKVGSIGNIGCFSFYPTKNLGAFGDGGMVVTNNKDLYEKLKLYRMYGEEKRYKSVLLGRNSRLDELQAAILLVKLKYLDKWIARRREIAKLYTTLISGSCHSRIPNYASGSSASWRTQDREASFGSPSLVSPASKEKGKANITLPFESSYAKHTYHLFVIRTKKRDELKVYLDGRGIKTGIHYPAPIHLQPSFQSLGHHTGDFPESEKASREVLSLPMFPELTEREIEQIVTAIKEFK